MQVRCPQRASDPPDGRPPDEAATDNLTAALQAEVQRMLAPTLGKPEAMREAMDVWVEGGMPPSGDLHDRLIAVVKPADVGKLDAAAAELHRLLAASLEGDVDAFAALGPARSRLFSI